MRASGLGAVVNSLIRFDLFSRLALFLGSLLALAGTASWLLWLFTTGQRVLIALAFKGVAMPPGTEFFLRNRLGLLILPAPWLLYAIWIIARGTAPIRVLIAFASTLILVLLTTTIVLGIEMDLPWGQHRVMTSWAVMRLDRQKLDYALEAASRGDAEAHYLLFRHYALTTRQSDLVEYYLVRAAELGHPGAKIDLTERQNAVVRPIPGKSVQSKESPEAER